jgi:wyosine [tRNA(Phe)-imidazoG37] synthetase (radical SAM superfamily)
MKIIYGPVASWRLGRSLGVDLICSPKKICSFDCIYCQLGEPKKITKDSEKFIKIDDLKMDLKNALKKTTPDVITLSGMGEPTLAENIEQSITVIRELTDLPIAILTNSSTLCEKKVRDCLSRIDIIVAKLDAANEKRFKRINQPIEGITLKETLNGIITMRKRFKGKFALQIMFMNENKKHAPQLAKLAREIKPKEIHINTPLRPCNVAPLTKDELEKIKKMFYDMNAISVYTSKIPATNPLDKTELIRRRRKEIQN